MKNRIKRFICMMLVVATCFTINTPAVHAQVKNGTDTGAARFVSTYKNQQGYLYTVINGHLYRRLWDYTMKCWIGDWELVD